jgi:hypothetical protein
MGATEAHDGISRFPEAPAKVASPNFNLEYGKGKVIDSFDGSAGFNPSLERGSLKGSRTSSEGE